MGEAHVNDIFRVRVTTVKTCVCLPLACPAELASGDISGKDECSKGLTFYYQPQKGTFAIPPSLVFLFTPHSLTAALHFKADPLT